MRTNSAVDTSKAIEQWITRFGSFYSLTSDQHQTFQSDVYQHLLDSIGATPKFTSSYRPHGNLSERLHQTVIRHLRNYISPNQRNWDVYLDSVLFGFNAQYQRSLKTSPFILVHAYEPILPSLEQISEKTKVSPKEVYSSLQKMRESAKDNLLESLKKTSEYVNTHRKAPHTYEEGDYCMISYPRATTHAETGELLSKTFKPHFKGPYMVIERRTPLSYKVKLVNPLKKNNDDKPFSVHVSRMKVYYGDI